MLQNLASLPAGSYVTDRHVKELRESGLSDRTIQGAHVYSASNRQIQKLLGYPTGPGLVFLYGDGYFGVKLDVPQAKGKQYRAPKGQPSRVYIPTMLDSSRLEDLTETLIVTEGEKKALKAGQDGLTCVSFPISPPLWESLLVSGETPKSPQKGSRRPS
jgi:hypothetical protein